MQYNVIYAGVDPQGNGQNKDVALARRKVKQEYDIRCNR